MEDKKAKLEALLWEYCKYTRWDKVNVFYKKEEVIVAWLGLRSAKEEGEQDYSHYLNFTMRRFPIEDINTRIKSYQDKIRYEESKLNKKVIEEV